MLIIAERAQQCKSAFNGKQRNHALNTSADPQQRGLHQPITSPTDPRGSQKYHSDTKEAQSEYFQN